jgi:hypothetical protein
MKKRLIKGILAILFLCVVCVLKADTYIEDVHWTEGHHEIYAEDSYNEIWMHNDCTLDIFGGDIYRLAAYDTTVTNWYNGSMDTLWARENSVVNIYGGQLGDIGAAEQSIINLYAYDTVLDNTAYILSGRYYSNNNFFTIDVHNTEVYAHINIVPEPVTLLFLGFGGLVIRKRK